MSRHREYLTKQCAQCSVPFRVDRTPGACSKLCSDECRALRRRAQQNARYEPRPVRKRSRSWSAEELALLGTFPDQVVADQLKLSNSCVRGKRVELAIPPCSVTRFCSECDRPFIANNGAKTCSEECRCLRNGRFNTRHRRAFDRRHPGRRRDSVIACRRRHRLSGN
jgi:hypothetical protein